MVHIKGVSVKFAINYIKRKFGEDKIPKILETLTPEDRDILSKPIMVSNWYPLKTWISLVTTADKLFGKGDLSLCYEIGYVGAEEDLNTIYKVFYKFGNPHFIISMASTVWKQYFDSGKLEVIKISNKEINVQLHNFEEPNLAHCRNIEGWMKKTIEMCGGKKSTVTNTKCRCKKDNYCEYNVKWE